MDECEGDEFEVREEEEGAGCDDGDKDEDVDGNGSGVRAFANGEAGGCWVRFAGGHSLVDGIADRD